MYLAPMSISTIISEDQIDRIIESLANPAQVEAMMLSLEQEAPGYLAYVFSEDTKMLGPAEQDALTFIIATFWKCTTQSQWTNPELSEDEISEIEEKNWDLLQQGKGDFREKLNVFFDNFSQEDMLAFIEDMLMDEEQEAISKEGKEHIFIICKTFLDIILT